MTRNDQNGWTALSDIDSSSRPDRIAELLRDAITTGRFHPGSQIVESRFARQLGVGQNAVREALHRLEFEGFVHKLPNVGTFVATITGHDLDQIYRMRIELEALAVYWAREKDRPGDADLARLSQHLDDAAQAARCSDLSAYAQADTAFHRCLWSMAGNKYLEKCLEVVAVPQLSCRLFDVERALQLDLDALVAAHRKWLDVIRTKPPRVALIFTRNLLSDLWGEVESAMRNANLRTEETTPSKAMGVSP